jgi:hypothetical protein
MQNNALLFLYRGIPEAGKRQLLKKRGQFQERVPDSPRKWNADDEPVNEKFEPVTGRLISLSHEKRFADGYWSCL